jgi:putative Ca2+/H+ antiporter (TMEM165/GDT1 family)
LIFISELPDKTAFASVLLATRNRPLPVFCGAAAAFVVQSLVAVAFGSVFSLFPAKIVHVGAALLFFVFAVSMWRPGLNEESLQDGKDASSQFYRVVSSAFIVIFFAEWGDLTQLATAALAAKYAAPFTILSRFVETQFLPLCIICIWNPMFPVGRRWRNAWNAAG